MDNADIRDSHTTVGKPCASTGQEGRALMYWVPSLAFAECLSMATILISTILFKRLGVNNDDITYLTAWLFLPWALRPVIQRIMPPTTHSRGSLVTIEALTGITILCMAFSLQARATALTLTCLLGIVGLCGAMHSIESDRLYDKASPQKRSRIYTIGYTAAFFMAMTACHALVVTFAGNMEVLTRTIRHSWSLAFYFLGCLFLVLAILHIFTLSRPDKRPLRISDTREEPRNLWLAAANFFRKKQRWLVAGFLILYLLPEGLSGQVASLFIIDARHNGGLGLAPAEYGLVQGTIAMIGLTLGGLLGGRMIRRYGLKVCLWPMALAMTVPNAVYIYLSHDMTSSLTVICGCVLFRQTMLGFGLSAYVMYLMHSEKCGIRLSHYSLCATFMALPIMVPNWYAGILQQEVGYRVFFCIATACGIVTLMAALLLTIAERHINDDIYTRDYHINIK